MPVPGGSPAESWPAHHHLGALQVHRHRAGVGPPELGAHEHVLIRESAPDGAEHIGTDRALYLHDAAVADPGWRRLGWPDVASVDWSRDSRTVTLQTWPTHAEPAHPGDPAVTVHVKEHSRLPEFVTERVTSCRVVSRRVRVSDVCTATISAHRDPARDGVTWTVFVDGERDRHDPSIARAVERALAELRSQLGC